MNHFVTGALRDVNVARMRVYADDQLEITSELLKAFLKSEIQREYHILRMSALKQATCGDPGRGQGDLGRSGIGREHRGAVSHIFHDALVMLRSNLGALRLKEEQKRALVQRYALRF